MRPFVILFFVLCLLGCSTDQEIANGTLLAALQGRDYVEGNVIACAASDPSAQRTDVFLYPRPGATNIRYFETTSLEAEKDDFSAYMEGSLPVEDLFNGYLSRIPSEVAEGHWVIVSFEEAGSIHLCNPIRIKRDSKPTEYLPQNVTLTDLSTLTPTFSWQDGSLTDTVIYFQVISNMDNDLLSGTYTAERIFQYYNTENVTLNITRDQPPELIRGDSYGFTLMGVSEDNWVNLFVEVPFSLQDN